MTDPLAGPAPGFEDRIRDLSPEKRALLEALLERRRTVGTGTTDRIPLSSAQRWLWLFERFHPGTPVYNVIKALDLSGPLDVDALGAAFDALVQKHPVLRSRIVVEDGKPARTVASSPSPALEVVAEDDPEKVFGQLGRLGREPFDLDRGPLCRLTLLSTGPQRHVLLLVVHHIVADRWALAILLRDLGAFYRAAISGDLPSEVEPTIGTASGENVAGGDVSFWEDYLAELPEPLRFPRERAPSSLSGYEGDRIAFPIPEKLTLRAEEVAGELGATPFMVWLAAFGSLVARYSRRSDMMIGVPVAHRAGGRAELVDYLIDMVPWRLDLSGDPSFAEVVDRIRTASGRLLGRPTEALDEAIARSSLADSGSLFQVSFAYQNTPEPLLDLPSIEAEHIDLHAGISKFDLTLLLDATGGRGLLEFRTSLFRRETIERLAEHLVYLATAAVAEPSTSVARLPLISPAEERRWIEDVNDTDTDFPRVPIGTAFERAAAERGDAVAVTDGVRNLTYRQLDELSERVARETLALGREPGARVGIALERSIEMVVAMLGVVKAGGVYVPIDPTYPDERIDLIVEDASLAALIARGPRSASTPEGTKVFDVDRLIAGERSAPSDRVHVDIDADAPAYIMYTSGSTGVPKGVLVPNRAVLRLVKETDYLQLTPDDVVAHISNVSFDAATFEVWGALLNGARLAILDHATVLSPPKLASALEDHGATALFITTALFNAVATQVPGAFAPLRHVLTGGESHDVEVIRGVLKDRPPGRLLNVYGPTEATTFASWHLIDSVPDDAATIPIGRPIANTTLYVLDDSMRPVPPGVPGDLYIGGPGVALGYVDRPELTRERFVPDPFRSGSLYRTGDLARRLPDGTIEFLGRVDRQVKLRGFRVEPGEVEAVLTSDERVRSALVEVLRDERGRVDLVAYVVPAAGDGSSPAEIRDRAKASLPSYMVPAFVVMIPELPLTPNGKIDRARLPSPRSAGDVAAISSLSGAVPPRDQLEADLLEIWTDVLGVEGLGVTSDFFDVGGQSLLAVQLFTRIESGFGRPVDLDAFMENPTIEGTASALREQVVREFPTGVVALQPIGGRSPFFCVPGVGGNAFRLHRLAQRFGRERRPFFALQALGVDGRVRMPRTIQGLAQIYVDLIRRTHPTGPYAIGGYSMGGLVAVEVARALRERGDDVSLLALIDTRPPGGKGRVGKKMEFHRKTMSRRGRAGWLRYVRKAAGVKLNRLTARVKMETQLAFGRRLPAEHRLEYVRRIHEMAETRYRPTPYPGVAHFFGSSGSTGRPPSWERWAPFVEGGIEVHGFDASHFELVEEPTVDLLASELLRTIDAAESTGEGLEPATREP